MFKKLYQKIKDAKYLVVAPVTQPSAILQAGIFQQNIGSIPQLTFLIPRNKIDANHSVDTSYNAETGKGEIFVPNTKDFYMGEG